MCCTESTTNPPGAVRNVASVEHIPQVHLYSALSEIGKYGKIDELDVFPHLENLGIDWGRDSSAASGLCNQAVC